MVTIFINFWKSDYSSPKNDPFLVALVGWCTRLVRQNASPPKKKTLFTRAYVGWHSSSSEFLYNKDRCEDMIDHQSNIHNSSSSELSLKQIRASTRKLIFFHPQQWTPIRYSTINISKILQVFVLL